MKTMRTGGVLGLVMGIVLIGSGCATNRGVLDIRVAVPENPSQAKGTVTIVRVTDQRQFQEAPRDASIPSLKGNEIGNKAITVRAIARKRNGFGKAIGDIVLPEGRTVEDVVRESLTRSFREAGYCVVAPNAPVSGVKPVEIEADIEQFWSWMTPGFWALALEFEAKVKIKGDVIPFKNSETVRGYVILHTQAAGTRAWANTINKGVEAFGQQTKGRLDSK